MNHELLTINNELRTTNYQLNTSDVRQATCDEFALYWSFYVSFCTFCASLPLTRTVFSRLLNKAVSMALWTKVSLCGKSSLLEQSLPRTLSRLKTSIISVAKNLFTPLETCFCFLMGCNPWLINDLRICKVLYICRDTFTDVMRALQIKLFMQNEPKFRKSQMNVNEVIIMDYEQLDTWSIGKNEPKRTQTNPKRTQNEPNFKKAEMNVTNLLTKDYENMSNWAICENEPKTNPNKPNACPPRRLAGLSAISVAGQRQKYAGLLFCVRFYLENVG